LVQEQIALAQGLRRNKDFDRAIISYRNAIALDPESSRVPDVRMEIADVLLEKKDYLSAADEYHAILKGRPSYTRAQDGLDELYSIFYEQGQILIRQKKPDEAIPAYEIAVRAKPSDVKTRLELKDLYVERRRFDEAIDQLGGVLEYTPDDTERRKERAQYLSWRRRFDESILEYRKVVDQKPGDIEANAGLARVTSWKGNYDEAIEAYQRILFVDPSYHKARLGIADITSWQGKFDESIKLYRIVLDGNPEHEDLMAALYGTGRVYSWKGDYDKSIEAYNEVFNHSPSDAEAAEANVGIGRVNNWKGDLEEAIAYYNRALEANPLNVDAYLGLGDVYLQQLKVKQSLSNYAKALEIDPGSELARKGLVLARTVKQSSVSLNGGTTITSYGLNNYTDLGLTYAYDRTSSIFYGLKVMSTYVKGDPDKGEKDRILYNPILNLSGTLQLPTNTALTLSFSQGIRAYEMGYLQEYRLEAFQSFDEKAFYNTPLDYIVNKTVLDASYALTLYPTDNDVTSLTYLQTLSPGFTNYILPELSLQVKYGLYFVLNQTDKRYYLVQTPNITGKGDYFNVRSQSVSVNLTYDTLSWFAITAGASYSRGYEESGQTLLRRSEFENYSFPATVSLNVFDLFTVRGGYEFSRRLSQPNPEKPVETNGFSFGVSYNF
jgi:tetratricopeptide (TPR) repeat protein